MGLSQDVTGSQTSALVQLEAELANALLQVAEDIEHAECFDEEERAEVYTILRAMLADSKVHRDLLEKLGQHLREEAPSV